MRISHLSEVTGQSVGTLKFYIRSGLLHHGTSISATQSAYDETHVARIRLIRALLAVGRLSHAEIGEVIGAMESRDDLPARLRRISNASGYRHLVEKPEIDRQDAALIVADVGWDVPRDSPHLVGLARALRALEDLGVPAPRDRVAFYAARARELAENDVEWVEGADDVDKVRAASVMVLWEQVLSSLHRLAAEHEAIRQAFCVEQHSEV